MQLCKALAKLKLLTINRQSAIGLLLALYRISWQTICIDAKEITNSRMLQLQIAGYTVKRHHMYDILLHRTKDPLQHIIEVHTNIRSYTARFVHITFP